MVNHRINLSCSCHSSSEDASESQPWLVSASCSPCPTCQGHSGNPGALLFLLSTSKDAPAPQKPRSTCPGIQKPQCTRFPDPTSFYFYSTTLPPWSEARRETTNTLQKLAASSVPGRGSRLPPKRCSGGGSGVDGSFCATPEA